MSSRRWTISMLTIPGREEYLQRLLATLGEARVDRHAQIDVVYNWDAREAPAEIEKKILKFGKGLPLRVAFNTVDPSIVGGRAQQLNACRTPLICFIDDDISVHGDLMGTLEDTLRSSPLGIVGVRSYVDDTTELFKPRSTTPHVVRGNLHYMTVQGMAVAGYRRLFLDVGGFNPRRRFWGEWTELNLRLWRRGFPTAYSMEGAFLRHWHNAPHSPTRNRNGREAEVLWGLMCTALEYDAVDINEQTESFWTLVADRYLPYSFGPEMSSKSLLSATLRLASRLTADWGRIQEFREETREHPFKFAPFASITGADVDAVLAHAEEQIAPYRSEVWSTPVKDPGSTSGVRRMIERLKRRPQTQVA